MPVADVWREDATQESLPQELALSNAPRQAAGQIVMPRVVEE
jgi:Asp-tRNA(Asn)/Glu-tRNA(Gln) amidotransferase C subunit